MITKVEIILSKGDNHTSAFKIEDMHSSQMALFYLKTILLRDHFWLLPLVVSKYKIDCILKLRLMQTLVLMIDILY